jgi:two-component system sensor histidine kinase ChiS
MPRSIILIVDDEPTTASMLGMLLEAEGFQTVVVHGARKAIQAIKEEKPALVILDVMMPELSGIELCRFIRQEPDFEDLPVVMISAKSQPEDMEAGIDAGATVYLTKPVSKDELVKGVLQGLNDLNSS